MIFRKAAPGAFFFGPDPITMSDASLAWFAFSFCSGLPNACTRLKPAAAPRYAPESSFFLVPFPNPSPDWPATLNPAPEITCPLPDWGKKALDGNMSLGTCNPTIFLF